jgi:hypothetical protein
MMRAPLIALAVATALPAFAQETGIALPSGRIVTFHDVIEAEDTLRYRFLEPDLAMVKDFVPYASLEADMHFLCETYALDLIEGGMPSQIFISISDRPVEFGTQDPDAAQVFEAYRPEDGTCIWEGF